MAEVKSTLKLIIGLYGILGASMGNRSREVKEAVLDPQIQPWFEDITYLKEACASVAANKTFSLSPLGSEIKGYNLAYSKNPKSTAVSVEILGAFAKWFVASSETGWKALQKNSANPLMPDWVPQLFSHKVESQAPIRRALENVVTTTTGKRGTIGLTNEECVKVKKKFPELYKTYLKLRSDFNANWKAQMSQFVLDSGERMVDFVDLEAYFTKNNVETSFPTGFTGKVDALGNVYDEDGKAIGKGLPNKHMFPTVRMNEDPGGKAQWVYQCIKPDGTPSSNYGYRTGDSKNNRKDRFAAMEHLAANIGNIRSRWLIGVKGFGEEHKETVAAVILELIHTYSCRIGSGGNSAKGEPTYGMSTLLRKHITFQPNGFTMKYLGKDGVPTKHVYAATDPVSKLVIKAVRHLCEGKKPNEHIFTYLKKTGDTFVRTKFPPQFCNTILGKLGGGEATAKTLRTMRGTSLFNTEMMELRKKRPTMSNMSEAMAFFNEIGMKVGTALNHVRRGTDGSTKVTASTAFTSYIDLDAQVAYFEFYGMPLPAMLSRKTRDIEASVLAGFEDDGSYDEEEEEGDAPPAGLMEEWLSGERDPME